MVESLCPPSLRLRRTPQGFLLCLCGFLLRGENFHPCPLRCMEVSRQHFLERPRTPSEAGCRSLPRCRLPLSCHSLLPSGRATDALGTVASCLFFLRVSGCSYISNLSVNLSCLESSFLVSIGIVSNTNELPSARDPDSLEKGATFPLVQVFGCTLYLLVNFVRK